MINDTRRLKAMQVGRHRLAMATAGALLLVFMLAGAVQAQGIKVERSTNDSGGGLVSSGNVTAQSTIGGPVGGAVSSNGTTVCSGFECDSSSSTPSSSGDFQFSQTPYDVNEGDGTATITVVRVGGSDGQASVDYATSDGSATAPGDYTATSGTLTFADGETTKDFNVPIVDDNEPEGTETVNLQLSNPTNGANVGVPGAATLRISDNDDAVVINEVFYLGDATGDWVELKNVGNTTVDISDWDLCSQITYGRIGDMTLLNGDFNLSPGEIVVVRAWRDLDNTAADLGLYRGIVGNDFDNADKMVDFVQWGTPNAVGRSTVARDAGMWRELSPGVFDSVPTATGNQSAQYDGSNSGPGQETWSDDFTNGTPSQGSENTTAQPVGNLQFSQTNYGVNEGDGSVTITVQRTGGSSGTVMVDYATSDGSATAPGDYTSNSGTLTFNDGETSKTFDVTIVDDNNPENTKTVILTLSNPTNGAGLSSPSAATITINDDDSSSSEGDLRFSQANYTVTEDVGTATVTVQRVGGSSGTVMVDYATSNNSATQPGDYAPTNGTLTFGDSVLSQTFNVTIVDDSDPEGQETINLTLSNPTNDAGLGNPAQATITINDNDSSSSEMDIYLPNIVED